MAHPLDNPLWAALTGPQAHLAERRGWAARFPVDVSPFAAIAGGAPVAETSESGVRSIDSSERRFRSGGKDAGDATAWADLAALVGPGGVAVVPGAPAQAPPGWEPVGAIPGVQMDGSGLDAAPEPEAVVLGAADVPEMLELVARTRPGPFLTRTIALGTYLGIRRGGELVAMAGERMRVSGFGEVSGVCVDPAVRGEGLGAVVTLAAARGIQDRGDHAMLHVRDGNDDAHRLYRRVGFVVRRTVTVAVVRPAS